jgi:hypothetical protein
VRIFPLCLAHVERHARDPPWRCLRGGGRADFRPRALVFDLRCVDASGGGYRAAGLPRVIVADGRARVPRAFSSIWRGRRVLGGGDVGGGAGGLRSPPRLHGLATPSGCEGVPCRRPRGVRGELCVAGEGGGGREVGVENQKKKNKKKKMKKNKYKLLRATFKRIHLPAKKNNHEAGKSART